MSNAPEPFALADEAAAVLADRTGVPSHDVQPLRSYIEAKFTVPSPTHVGLRLASNLRFLTIRLSR